MKVSNSRVSCYSFCPCKHYFGYVLRLKRKKPCRPLTFGSDFHTLLEFRSDSDKLKEALTKIDETYYDMPPIFQGELGDTYLDDLKVIFQDYGRVWKKSEKPIETEHEFLVKIGTIKGEPVYFHGIIDEVYEGLVMGEHKTFSRQPDMGILAMNMQVCLYAKAWELETGHKFQRVRWDYIKSTPAEQPIWLEKSQRFSEATSQKITPYSWKRACVERGITDEEIINKADNYQQNVSNFFFRCDMEILPIMVDTLWDSFKDIVRDIASRGNTNKTKHISRDCSWCDFRPLCYAEFTGADVNYIIDTDFTIKDEQDIIEIEAD